MLTCWLVDKLGLSKGKRSSSLPYDSLRLTFRTLPQRFIIELKVEGLVCECPFNQIAPKGMYAQSEPNEPRVGPVRPAPCVRRWD
jgi:hypothetical protein